MLLVWRTATARVTDTAFSGEGVRLYDRRSNPKGWPVIYTAASQSLTLLELMVQDDPLRAHYMLIPAQLPDDLPVTSVEVEDLPADWRTLGARSVLQEIGRIWLDEGSTAVMSVPSVVAPAERNYLVNPTHPDFAHIPVGTPRSLEVDTRLLRNLG